jgi:hypothetical protein
MDVRRLVKDRNGGVLLETTVMITIVFTFVLGSVDLRFTSGTPRPRRSRWEHALPLSRLP